MKKIKFVILSLGAFYFSYSQPKEGQTILNFEVKDSSFFNNVEKGITHLVTVRISEKSIQWQFSKPLHLFIDEIIYQTNDSCFYYISSSEKKIWKQQKHELVQSQLKIATDFTSPILKLNKSYWNRLKTEKNANYYFTARHWVAENEHYGTLPIVKAPELLMIDGQIVTESRITSESSFGNTSSVCFLKGIEKANSQKPILLPNYQILPYNQEEVSEILRNNGENEVMERIQNGNL